MNGTVGNHCSLCWDVRLENSLGSWEMWAQTQHGKRDNELRSPLCLLNTAAPDL